MKPLELQSERYGALGNLASEGVKNQLGRPRLDQLTVLIRESVQNSWDAHDPASPQITFDLRVETAEPSMLRVLKDSVFHQEPENFGIGERLAELATNPDSAAPFHMVIISDRHTSGLGGPTRADVLEHDGDEPHDFVDFLRNIGQPPDKSHGGGTFGYGKAALYAVSQQSVILSWTQCRYQGKTQKRLIVTGLGDGYTVLEGENRGRYTGRHWWGAFRDDLVEPLLNARAEAVAKALGLPLFEPGVNGTTIAILDADFGLNRTAKEATVIMTEALLWNFWPKMVRDASGKPAIQFSVSLNGEDQPLPPLRDAHPISGFADAYGFLKAKRSGQAATTFGTYQEVWCRKPKVLLGWLALTRGRVAAKRLHATSGTGGIHSESSHHMALMRDAELVVRYLDGPALQAGKYEYSGVFIAHRDVDRSFAAAEPPTHDDWVVQNMKDRRHRTLVNVALREIHHAMSEYASPTGERKSGGTAMPLGQVASQLGTLLTGMPGTGAEVQPSKSTKKKARRAKVKKSGPVIEEVAEELPWGPAPLDVEEGPLVAADGESLETGSAEADPGSEPTTPVPTDYSSSENDQSLPPPKPLRIGRPRVKMLDSRLAILDGRGTFQITFDLTHGTNSQGTVLEADVAAELDGNAREKEPPVGASVPEVLAWLDPTGMRHDTPSLTAEAEGTWTVVLTVVEDTNTRASILPTAMEAGT